MQQEISTGTTSAVIKSIVFLQKMNTFKRDGKMLPCGFN